MFLEGELRKYVELAEEALKLRAGNPIRAIEGLKRVQELMEEYQHEVWKFEMPSDCEEPMEEYIKLRDAFHMFSITEAKTQNTWFDPAENYDGRGVKVADIRRYLDDWHVFFNQKTNASLIGKPKPNTLDDALSYEQRIKMVDGEGENEIEIKRDFEEISTTDLLAYYLCIAIGNEKDELIDEAYVRGFIDKNQKEKMYHAAAGIKACQVTKKEENIIINKTMGGLIRYNSDETRDEYARRMNNSLHEYNKIARDILKRSVPAEIDSLIEDIEKGEWMLHFDKRIIKEFDYTYVNNNGVERKIHGPWDYETFCEVFENLDCRKQIEEILKKEPYNKQDTLIEEYEIQCLHSALKTELVRAKKLEKIKNNAQSRVPHPGDSTHFSKRVSDEELTAIYNGLMEHEMLCNNPTLAEFIYWHTGQGSKPAEPLMWKTKNVCRYYVFRYLDSDWPTAENCFSCKRGSISNLMSASNITKDNREIINEILKKARSKSTKNMTKTD